MDSFAQQLAGALEGYLGGSSLQIDIQPAESQGSGVRQFLVTVNQKPDAGVQTTSSAPAAPTGATTSSAASTTTASPSSTNEPAPTNELDAYWATQPPEVQALRDVQDEGDRGTMAQKLASEGFKIDVPIMVWKWDPLITMTIRQNSGYTWVPSGDQAPLPTCPNCDVPGLPSYDPNNPPAGSITVSTDFAKGLEKTAPWGLSA